MTPAHDGANTPGSPGGSTAAGATPLGDVDTTSAGPAQPAEHAPSSLHDLEEAVHQLEAEAEHRPPPAGPLTNLIVAVAVVALGAAAVLGSLSLGAGSARTPGSGLWPLLISVVLLVLGLGLVATARRTSDAERFSRSTWLVVAGLATMIGFVAVFGTIGFEIPAAVLTFVWLRFLGGETWRSSIVTTVAVVAAFYVLFVAVLSVPIPHLF